MKTFYEKHIISLNKSLDNLDFSKCDEFVKILLECNGKIFFTGIGKNGHVAAKAASTFSSIGIPCFFIDAVDSVHGDMGVISDDDVLVAISKSGNTEELLNFLHNVKRKCCKIISIHSNPGNKTCDYSMLDINLYVDNEADNLNIVPTSSIVIYTVFLQSIACEIAKINNLTLSQFVFNHPGGTIGKLK